MKRFSLLILFFIPLILFSQSDSSKGIQWIEDLSWEQVKSKAKAEDKYIFIDFYATWCLPCKAMDKKVYPLEEVGSFFNEHFLSIKIQIDTTNNDNEKLKRRYADAHFLMVKYQINQFPTFLFFSPKGKLVHKAVGGIDSKDFISEAKNALNPETQVYSLLEKYEQGRITPNQLKTLAKAEHSFGNKNKAKEIVKAYASTLSKTKLLDKENIRLILYYSEDMPLTKRLADRYIGKLSESEFYNKENIEFIKIFTQSSKDKGFKLFFEQGKKIDSIMGVIDYGRSQLDYIITKEEIDPLLIKAMGNSTKPDWDNITKNIDQKYNHQYADRTITSAKLRWYNYKQDYTNYVAVLIPYVQKNIHSIDNWHLNNYAWDLFEKSKDTNQLKIAALWSERAIKMDTTYSNSYDTYANILYKLGRIDEAIKSEEAALKLEPTNEEYRSVLNRMKKGEIFRR